MVACLEVVGFAGAGGDDVAFGFAAEDGGEGAGVEARAEVGVDVVDADVGVADEDFAGGGGGHR